MRDVILCGDVFDKLRDIPDKHINMVMTSPPYWSLRNYDAEGQIGLEYEPEDYINKLCDVFDEIKRVLRDDGTLWINIGDTYYGSGKGAWKNKKSQKERYVPDKTPKIKKGNSKSLAGIPFLFAIEMMNRGWILRNTIIWHKENAMPTSAKDRFTVDFEYIFFFSKNKKYYFQTQREPHKLESIKRAARARSSNKLDNNQYSTSYKLGYIGYDNLSEDFKSGKLRGVHPNGRNKRTVWTINTKPFKDAHFAIFPLELVEIPLKAGCPDKQCKKCGKPIHIKNKPVGVFDSVEEVGVKTLNNNPYSIKERDGFVEVRDLPSLFLLKNYLIKWRKNSKLSVKRIEELMESQAPHHWFSGESYPSKEDWYRLKKLLNFDDEFDKNMTEIKYKSAKKLETDYKEEIISCDCNAGFESGIVLDPFFGAGTVGVIAKKQGKSYIGIDLNSEYCKIAKKRIEESK